MNNPINAARTAKSLGITDRFLGFLTEYFAGGTLYVFEQNLVDGGYTLTKCDIDKADCVSAVDLSGKNYTFDRGVEANYLNVQEVAEIFDCPLETLRTYLQNNTAPMLTFFHDAERRNAQDIEELQERIPMFEESMIIPEWYTARDLLRYVSNYSSPEETGSMDKYLRIALSTEQYQAIRLARYDDSLGNGQRDYNALVTLLNSTSRSLQKVVLDRYPVSYRDLYRWCMRCASPDVEYEVNIRFNYMFNFNERMWFGNARR